MLNPTALVVLQRIFPLKVFGCQTNPEDLLILQLKIANLSLRHDKDLLIRHQVKVKQVKFYFSYYLKQKIEFSNMGSKQFLIKFIFAGHL